MANSSDIVQARSPNFVRGYDDLTEVEATASTTTKNPMLHKVSGMDESQVPGNENTAIQLSFPGRQNAFQYRYIFQATFTFVALMTTFILTVFTAVKLVAHCASSVILFLLLLGHINPQ
jgi:hypothetical protein